jgi:DNA-binding PadR family transcriptional regulator
VSDRRSLGMREFEILVTLVAGPKHGYGIMGELRETGGGGRILGPGTLYRVLKDLESRGWIAVATRRNDESGGPPRRYYRLTSHGHRIVSAEVERLANLVDRARPLLARPAG